MYRLLAIAKYEERYVIPSAHAGRPRLEELATDAALDFDGGPGMCRDRSGRPAAAGTRRGGDLPPLQAAPDAETIAANAERRRVNLLNWDGKGAPTGMFPRGASERSKLLTRRSGRARPPTRAMQDRLVWQAASLLLAYPDDDCRAARHSSTSCSASCRAGPPAALLQQTVAALRAATRWHAAVDYVDTFDLRRRAQCT